MKTDGENMGGNIAPDSMQRIIHVGRNRDEIFRQIFRRYEAFARKGILDNTLTGTRYHNRMQRLRLFRIVIQLSRPNEIPTRSMKSAKHSDSFGISFNDNYP